MVLGAGMVGRAMAIDLTTNHEVTLTDINSDALAFAKSKCKDLSTQSLNVTDTNALKGAIAPFDLVICAVPGFSGYNTLKNI